RKHKEITRSASKARDAQKFRGLKPKPTHINAYMEGHDQGAQGDHNEEKNHDSLALGQSPFRPSFFTNGIFIASFVIEGICLEILRKETLYGNLEKCTFYTYEVVFFGFIVGSHRVKVDKEKLKVIHEWPTFHRLASFYKRFVRDFNTIAIPLNKIIKKSVGFKWRGSQERIFQALKDRLTQA
ncbi:putative mitochondrial protein, partial [Mucuna pruriens]